MGFLRAAVERRVATTVILLIAIIMGGLAYVSLPVRRFPEVEFPIATVTTVYAGGSPEEVETEITKRIEDAVSSIAGIDEIRSYSQQGLSLVMVGFELEHDIDVKAMDIRDSIDQVLEEFPEDAEDPVVGKFDISQEPVVTLALTGPQTINELYRLADERLEQRLSQVSGVAQVQLAGGQRREIHVLLDPTKLRRYDVSVQEVAAALRARNMEVPAGHITQPATEYTVRVRGRFESVGEVEEVAVRRSGRETLRIRHLAQVVDTYEEERTRSRADGNSSIILTILKQSDANDVEISDGVQALVPELREMLPEEAKLFITEDTSDFVRGALSNVRQNIVLGIILTSLALYLFLGSMRGTLIAVVVMPSALVVTFLPMLFTDVTLNILTLTALALAMGIVVNNAILILENSHRFVEQGAEPADAAIQGTADIGLAIISSTATNLVVFLPIAFMGELIGRFFREFGLTIVYVTSVSLFVSFTLTPMMCGALLKAEEEVGEGGGFSAFLHGLFKVPHRAWMGGFSWVRERYFEMLGWCVRWRKTTIFLTIAFLLGAVALMATVVGTEFFPASDEGRFRVSVETKVGSSLDFTTDRVRAVEDVINRNVEEEYLLHHYSRVGQVSGFLGSSSRGTHLAEVGVSLVDKAERPLSVQQILNRLRPHLAEVHSAKLTATSAEQAGPGGAPLQVEVRGQEIQQLQEVAERVMEIVGTTAGTSDVSQSYRAGQPEIQLIPLPAQAARHGVRVGDLAQTVRTYVEGSEVTQYRDRGEDYDVRVKLQERYRRWGEDVNSMFIRSPGTGQMVQIRQLARPRYGAGPTVITRKDRRRLITVSAQLTGERSLGDVKNMVEARVGEEISLPPGVDISYGGEVEQMRENFPEIFQAMGTAGVLTFLCVAGIIESFLFAVIILLALPVCAIGVALALLIGNVSLNIFSLMAMVMLVGMVVNNAIIILDYATREEHKHLTPAKRVTEACQVRFRVIIMANLTTILAMVPLSLGLGFAGEVFRPIAVVEMGGVFAAATLSMLVVPAIFTAVQNVREGVGSGEVSNR